MISMRKLKEKRSFTVREAALYAGISYGIMRYWITSGFIPYEELPGSCKGDKRFILIRKFDLDNFLENRRQKASQ